MTKKHRGGEPDPGDGSGRRTEDRPGNTGPDAGSVTVEEARALERLNLQLSKSLQSAESDLRSTIDELQLKNSAVENLAEGVMITDNGLDWPGPRIHYVNPAMCRISGYRRDELVGATPRILQGERTDRATLDHLKSELAANRPVKAELTNYRKDGSAYDTGLYIGPLFDNGGQRTNFVSIHSDISGRKRAERELREQKSRLEAILNTSAEAIVTIDYRGIIDSVNPRTESLFGYGADELVGRNVSMLMPSPHRQEHDAYIERYLRTGEARVIGRHRELLARHRDGTMIPIALSIDHIEDQRLFAGFIRDLTEVRDLQREVLDAASDEDHRIGQELHDNIQQQLTGLALLAGNLADTLTAESPREADEAARLNTELRRVIRQLQMLSRGLIPVDVDAEGLRSALETLVTRICETTALECRFRCGGDIRLANNQLATHLYRIAQEAINNVVRHGWAERLEVSLTREDGAIRMRIEDDGIGIGELSLEHGGFGLRMMRYRANLIGATFHVGPGARGGTRVLCSLSGNATIAQKST